MAEQGKSPTVDMPAEPNHDMIAEQAAKIVELVKENSRLNTYGERIYRQMRAAQSEARMAKRELENHQRCATDVGVKAIRENEGINAKIESLEKEKRAQSADTAMLQTEVAMLKDRVATLTSSNNYLKHRLLNDVVQLISIMPKVPEFITSETTRDDDHANPIPRVLYKRDKYVFEQANTISEAKIKHWRDQHMQAEARARAIETVYHQRVREGLIARHDGQVGSPPAKRPRLEGEGHMHGTNGGDGVQTGNGFVGGNGGNSANQGVGIRHSTMSGPNSIGNLPASGLSPVRSTVRPQAPSGHMSPHATNPLPNQTSPTRAMHIDPDFASHHSQGMKRKMGE